MRRRARAMRSTTSTATRGPPASMHAMRWSAWSSASTRSRRALSPPKVTNLDAYLSEPAFRAIVPEVVWQKAEYIRQAGNVAVHANRTPAPEQALNVVRELAHVLYWAGRTYLRRGAENLHGKTFDESLVPTPESDAEPASVEELDALKRQLDAAEDARKDVEGELEALRERLAAIKAENEAVPETRDWNEAATRRLIIDLALHACRLAARPETRPRVRSHRHAERLWGRLRRLRPVGR